MAFDPRREIPRDRHHRRPVRRVERETGEELPLACRHRAPTDTALATRFPVSAGTASHVQASRVACGDVRNRSA